MEVENNINRQHLPAASTYSSTSIDAPPSTSQVVEENDVELGNEGNPDMDHHHHHEQEGRHHSSGVSYRLNISVSDVAASRMRDDVWSCLAVILTFWFFASMIVILGYYGSTNLELGPNCSVLVQPNTLFVQSLKAEELGEPKPGPMLYGFYKPPPLDVEITWTQNHTAVVPTDFHKEWALFLNKGSKVDILYSVKSLNASPLSLVIAQGRDSLVEWIDDPSYPNTTLSWNIVYGSGSIQQEISKSSTYYIAVGNLNFEEVEVELKFIVKSFIYNTSQAHSRCSLCDRLCSLRLYFLAGTAAVLTTPGPKEGASEEAWYVRLSYGPRWVAYIIGSGAMTVLILFAVGFCNMCQTSDRAGYHQAGDQIASERTPLLSQKDEDNSSWASSYDSNSHEDEADLEKWLAENCVEGKPGSEGENLLRLCVICFDAPRDCFFLPCGHCAACFTCGTRIAEEAGSCPICRRSMKKVRKIFTV